MDVNMAWYGSRDINQAIDHAQYVRYVRGHLDLHPDPPVHTQAAWSWHEHEIKIMKWSDLNENSWSWARGGLQITKIINFSSSTLF